VPGFRGPSCSQGTMAQLSFDASHPAVDAIRDLESRTFTPIQAPTKFLR